VTSQCGAFVLPAEQAASLQDGYHAVDKVFQPSGQIGRHEVEAVGRTLREPLFDPVDDLLDTAHHGLVTARTRHAMQQLPDRQLLTLRQRHHEGRSAPVRLDRFSIGEGFERNRTVERIGTEVHAREVPQLTQAVFGNRQFIEFGCKLLCLHLGSADDRTQTDHNPHLLGVTLRGLHAADRRRRLVRLSQARISPIPSTATTFFDLTVPRYPYDLTRAEALLDEAGLPRGPNGTRFAVTHDPVPYGDDFHRSGEYVKQSLKRVGIDVTLRTQDIAVFTKRVYGDRDFDISSSWTALFSDPQIGCGKIYTSSIIGKNVPWTNASGYRNPEVDAIFAEAQLEPDQQKRVALFNCFQHIVQTDLPILPLIELNFFSVVASNLRDAVTASDPSLRDAWLAA
jgi:hypothetical protein